MRVHPLLLLLALSSLTACDDDGSIGNGYGSYGSLPVPGSSSYQQDRERTEGYRPSSSSSYSSTSSASESGPVRIPFDGRVSESPTGNRVYRDREDGQIVGSEWTSPAGTTTYRDSDGRILGNSSTSPAGTTTYRDSDGQIALSSSTTQGTGGDSTTTYRQNGVIVGTEYHSPAGNTTWRDGSGQIIDGPSGMKP